MHSETKLSFYFFLSILLIPVFSFSQTEFIHGYVYHAVDSTPQPFTNVGLMHSSSGTMTNIDGYFQLKYPSSSTTDTLLVSHLGFTSHTLDTRILQDTLIIYLTPAPVELEEVVITPMSIDEILDSLLSRVPSNYATKEAFYEGAFTEWFSCNNNGKLTEAAFLVHTPPHSGQIEEQPGFARIKLQKGRVYDYIVEEEVKRLVSVAVGPHSAARKDLVHKFPLYLQPKRRKWFNYKIEAIHPSEEGGYYEISFAPKQGKRKELYGGTLYIDSDTYALLRADTYLPDASKPYAGPRGAGRMFLRMQGFELSIDDVTETIIYKKSGDQYYLWNSQTHGKVSVSHREKEKAYSLSISTHMNFTPMTSERAARFPDREIYSGEGLENVTGKYEDDYWQEYNRMAPSKALKQALEKVRNHSKTYTPPQVTEPQNEK